MLAALRAAVLLGTSLADPFGTAACYESISDVGQMVRTLRTAAHRDSPCDVWPPGFSTLPAARNRQESLRRLAVSSVCFAEREGFEPSVQFPVHMISNHAPSAARSPLRRLETSLGGEAAAMSLSQRWWERDLRQASYRSGERGIRTLGTLAGTPDFESGTFGHSDISPPRTMAAEGGSVNEIAARFCRFFGAVGRLRKGRDPEDSRGHAAVWLGGGGFGSWCCAERVRTGAVSAGPRAHASTSRSCASISRERAGSGVRSGRASCSSRGCARSRSRTSGRSASRRAGRQYRAAAASRRQSDRGAALVASSLASHPGG